MSADGLSGPFAGSLEGASPKRKGLPSLTESSAQPRVFNPRSEQDSLRISQNSEKEPLVPA